MAISSHHLAQEKQPQETNGMKINANVVESATCRDHIAPRRGSHFCLLFVGLDKK